MAQVQLEHLGDTQVLTATGEFTIQDASRLWKLLTEAVASSAALQADLHQVAAIDLACVQVLCAAQKTLQRAGRGITLTGTLPAGVVKILQEIGIEARACEAPCSTTCLWAQGAQHA